MTEHYLNILHTTVVAKESGTTHTLIYIQQSEERVSCRQHECQEKPLKCKSYTQNNKEFGTPYDLRVFIAYKTVCSNCWKLLLIKKIKIQFIKYFCSCLEVSVQSKFRFGPISKPARIFCSHHTFDHSVATSTRIVLTKFKYPFVRSIKPSAKQT